MKQENRKHNYLNAFVYERLRSEKRSVEVVSIQTDYAERTLSMKEMVMSFKRTTAEERLRRGIC